MAIERTLADPLSTQEIKEIILQELKRRLDSNSLLTDGLTYPWFAVKFESEISLPNRETLVWSDTGRGEKEGDAQTTFATFSYTPQSPNEARESHDLPIPVEIRTPSGVERRKVKFQK